MTIYKYYINKDFKNYNKNLFIVENYAENFCRQHDFTNIKAFSFYTVLLIHENHFSSYDTLMQFFNLLHWCSS